MVILCLGLMGFVGFMLAARNWFGAETRIVLPRLITQIALPPFLMYTIMHSFHRNELLMLAKGGAAAPGLGGADLCAGGDSCQGCAHQAAALWPVLRQRVQLKHRICGYSRKSGPVWRNIGALCVAVLCRKHRVFLDSGAVDRKSVV